MEDLFNQLDRPVDLYVTYAVIIPSAHVGDAISRAMKAQKEKEKRKGESGGSRDVNWQQLLSTDTSHASTHEHYCYQ